MKQILSITGIMALAILFTSAISMRLSPQDPPEGKKKEKHIKLVKVSEDGTRTELDTVIGHHEVFIWKGDTIGASKMDLSDIENFVMDLDIDEGGKKKVFIMKPGMNGAVQSFAIKGDSCANMKLFSAPINGHCKMMLGNMHALPKMIVVDHNKKKNVIDLSDPGIISYDKKELKDGTEKITIVRNKPTEEENCQSKMIMQSGCGQPMMFHGNSGFNSGTTKVICGSSDLSELNKVVKTWNIEEGSDDVKVIEEDGKVIIIKKKISGDQVEVDVEVKEEVEEK